MVTTQNGAVTTHYVRNTHTGQRGLKMLEELLETKRLPNYKELEDYGISDE
jgi:hypothetical protein